ncbi:MAG: hypothetical protein R3B49_03665 [Phycisphaerales bacterium]
MSSMMVSPECPPEVKTEYWNPPVERVRPPRMVTCPTCTSASRMGLLSPEKSISAVSA